MSRASEQKNSYFHSFLLLMTATIWGVAFVAQSVGMDHVGPITFVAARNVVAVVALVPVVFYFKGRNARKNVARPVCDRRTFWTGGILCGTLLFGGMVTQQIGLVYTTVGKAGFITTTYVVLVPLLGIILGRKIGLRMWLAVLLAPWVARSRSALDEARRARVRYEALRDAVGSLPAGGPGEPARLAGRPATVVAVSTESTNGTVCLTKTMPGKFASRALPSVSAVMPVLSDTKYAARTARVVVSVVVVSAMRRH